LFKSKFLSAVNENYGEQSKDLKKNILDLLQNVKRITVTKDYGPATLYFVVILLLVTLFLRTQNLSLHTYSVCTVATNCKVPRCISLNAHISVALTSHFVPLRNLARTSVCVPAPIHRSTKLVTAVKCSGKFCTAFSANLP